MRRDVRGGLARRFGDDDGGPGGPSFWVIPVFLNGSFFLQNQ
jgi:hypothetical protein